jgi:hypothetical protein
METQETDERTTRQLPRTLRPFYGIVFFGSAACHEQR